VSPISMTTTFVFCLNSFSPISIDLYVSLQARRTQLATHESLKGVAHPSSLYEVSSIMREAVAVIYIIAGSSEHT